MQHDGVKSGIDRIGEFGLASAVVSESQQSDQISECGLKKKANWSDLQAAAQPLRYVAACIQFPREREAAKLKRGHLASSSWVA